MSSKGPLIYDSLDKPNSPTKLTNRESSAPVIAFLLSLVFMLFVALILVYRTLDYKCTIQYNQFACVGTNILLYAPVLFICALLVVTIYITIQYARRMGWLDSFTANLRVDGYIPTIYTTDVNLAKAKSLSTANVSTLTDSHDKTQSVKTEKPATQEIPVKNGFDQQDEIDLAEALSVINKDLFR